MKTKFSSKKSLLLLFLIPLTALAFFLFNTKKETATLSENATVAEKYAQFLENHPFRKTMQLSKKERAKLGLPPNKYYEQEWLYTSDPVLLRPAPERVHELQKEIASNPAMRTPVGTGSNVWVERGPDNVGGRTHTLMFAPGSSTKVFAGGVSGGLWVNNNITSSATQWQQVTGVPGNMAVMCMTVDPNDSNTMYIGTGEVYTWGAVNGNGVYKSTDGGNNWTLIYSGGTSAADKITYIQDIIAWNNPSTNQTEIFFGADSMAYTEEVTSTSGGAGWTWLGENTIGLYRSTDGVNFSRLTGSLYESSSGNYFAPNDFDIGADGTLWMGTKYSYYTGEGGGRVFKNTGTGWSLVRDLGDNGRVELGCSKQTANKIYALCEDRTSTTNPVKIYLTTNGFSTAPTSLSQPNDADTGISASDFTRGQSFYDLMIGVDPNNDATVYVGGIDLFKSTNSGSSWSQFSHWYGGFGFQEVHADQHGIAFSSSSRIVFSNDGGVYYTNNGGSTTSARNNGYNVTQFYKGAINQQTSTTKLLAGAQDNGSQFINNAAAGINSSTEIQGGDGCWCFIDQDNQYLITSYVYNSYYRHNYTTGAQQSTIASNTSDGDFVNQCGLDSSTNILYANGTTSTPAYRIYRYSNITGTASRTTLTNTMLDTYPIAFVASPFTNNRILVGTALGKIIRLDNANGTPTWTDISMPGQVGAVSDIRYGQTENDIMVTFHNYGVTSVWYTSNGGSSWVSKEGNLPDMPVKCILQNPLATDEVIIGTELGVWVTSNWSAGSPTWTQSQNGMSDVKVTSFDFRSADNTIIASTYGRGMFTGTFEAATTSAEIGFQTTAQSNAEGTGCSYTDIDVTVSIAQGATANADVSFSVNGSSTATAGVDFDLMTTMVTFPAGSTANQTMTVRVYEDGFVEGDETVIIDLSVNANGGDAVANTSADTYTLTITNDDAAPVASSTNVLGFYDMESLTGWQALDDDGDGNNWLTLTGLTWTGITGTFLGSETDLTILGGSGSATPDNYLISPPFTISSSATNVEFNFGIGGYQTQEHYAVYWTTDITNASTMNSGLLLEERNSLSNNSEFRSINTSAIAGQTGYLIIRHYNTTGNGILLFDTLTVTESITSGIQTAVNTGTPDQFNINGSGTAYSYDPTSGYIMAGITNNNSFDYGCTDVAVSRSGTGAQSYNGSTSPNFVTDKTFTITPSNTNTSGSTSVTFYFEEAEIAGWESATGLSRTALVIARGNATSVTETTAVTIGSFGTEVTLTGNFTGLNGTYYFGPTNAFVSLCAGVAKIWNGSSWSPSGAPNSTNSVVINGNYDTTSDGNLDACTLTVNTGFTLTINAGEYAKVENNIVVDGTLIVEHQGSLVQVDDSATVTNNGTINVNLTTPNLASRDFMVLGSPMSADTRTGVWNAAFLVLNHLTANFVPNPAVAAAFPGAENFADDNYDNWVPYSGGINVGEGYIVRPQSGYGQPGGIFNYTYNQGTLNNGVVNFNVIYNTPGPLPADNKNASPNIFANPYASAISADDFITANAMVDEVYFWEHLTPPSSTLPGAGAMNFHMQDISMYNLMGGTQAANDLIGTTTPNGVISTGQGFGIKANAAGTAVFNNSMRLTSGNTTLRGPDVNRERIWLKISNTAFDMQNTTLIGFSDNATAGLDSGYDSRRLATVLSLYSHLEDGTQQLGIQSREAFESGIKVPLGFSSQLEGEWEYSLSIADLEGANLSEATVYLMDNLLGTVVNLSEAPYVFRSIEGTFHGRFTVMFEYEPTLGIGGDVLQQINMFPNPTEHVVNIVSPKAIIQSIAVYDLQGRKILMEQHQSNNVQIDFSDLQSSVYFVEIRTESGTVSKRVVRK